MDYIELMEIVSLSWRLRAIMERMTMIDSLEERMKLSSEYRKLFKRMQRLSKVDF